MFFFKGILLMLQVKNLNKLTKKNFKLNFFFENKDGKKRRRNFFIFYWSKF